MLGQSYLERAEMQCSLSSCPSLTLLPQSKLRRRSALATLPLFGSHSSLLVQVKDPKAPSNTIQQLFSHKMHVL